MKTANIVASAEVIAENDGNADGDQNVVVASKTEPPLSILTATSYYNNNTGPIAATTGDITNKGRPSFAEKSSYSNPFNAFSTVNTTTAATTTASDSSTVIFGSGASKPIPTSSPFSSFTPPPILSSWTSCDRVNRKGKKEESVTDLSSATTTSVLLSHDPAQFLIGNEQIDYKTRLIAFYTKNNPSKLGAIDSILTKYAGKEEEMFRRLEAKYKIPKSATSSTKSGPPLVFTCSASLSLKPLARDSSNTFKAKPMFGSLPDNATSTALPPFAFTFGSIRKTSSHKLENGNRKSLKDTKKNPTPIKSLAKATISSNKGENDSSGFNENTKKNTTTIGRNFTNATCTTSSTRSGPPMSAVGSENPMFQFGDGAGSGFMPSTAPSPFFQFSGFSSSKTFDTTTANIFGGGSAITAADAFGGGFTFGSPRNTTSNKGVKTSSGFTKNEKKNPSVFGSSSTRSPFETILSTKPADGSCALGVLHPISFSSISTLPAPTVNTTKKSIVQVPLLLCSDKDTTAPESFGRIFAPYQAQTVLDGSSKITIHSITAMQQYADQSFDELRLGDYRKGNHGNVVTYGRSTFESRPSAFTFFGKGGCTSSFQDCDGKFHGRERVDESHTCHLMEIAGNAVRAQEDAERRTKAAEEAREKAEEAKRSEEQRVNAMKALEEKIEKRTREIEMKLKAEAAEIAAEASKRAELVEAKLKCNANKANDELTVRDAYANFEERRVWECDIGEDWVQYPSYVSELLEKQFLSGGGRVTFVLYYPFNEYEINLSAAPIVQLNTKTQVKRSVRSIIKQYATLSNGVPATWLPHDAGENCKMVRLCNSSKEWDYVEKMLSSDLPNAKLIKVERVQNINLWTYFCFRRKEVRKLSGETDTKSVWHGTRDTDPMCICNDKKDGFMTQQSRKGKWGYGTYFAAKASYSNQYAYMGRQKPPSTLSHQKKQTKSLILAKLVVGDAVFLKPDSTLRCCPHKNKGQGRYDTVTGVTGGSKIYVVYENGRAYPEYLVTYM